jgi:uncharacterized protein YraI
MKRIVVMVIVGLLLMVAVLPAGAQSNLLQNPGFDSETFSLIASDPLDPNTTYNAPLGWWGGFIPPQTWGETWRNAYPAGFPHSGGLKRSGIFSYNMARGGATFTAWLYQQVSVQPNTDVQGGAWAFLENPVSSLVRVGIDPTGGTDPFSGNVVWSNWGGSLYQWNFMSVNARAQSGTITFFIYAGQDGPGNPNGVYWDEAFLNGIPGSSPVTTSPSTSSGAPAPAAPAGQVVTSNVRVNVRSGPGTEFDRIGRLNPGDAFTFLEQTGGWVKIDYNGQQGYVSAAFVTISGGQPSGGGSPVVVSGDALDFTTSYSVRLRSAPSTSSQTLATIPFNTTIQAIGRTGDYQWLQVVYNGQTGWVAARFGRLNDDINRLPVIG